MAMTENPNAVRDWRAAHAAVNTWGDVLDFVQANGLDDAEYFHVFPAFSRRHPDRREEPVYQDACWIAVFWVVGGSEGYYVHVEKRDEDKAELVLLGKFWNRPDAELAAQLLQRLVNN